MNNPSLFKKRSGCYTCEDCGKLTRDTGAGECEERPICKKCYYECLAEIDFEEYGHLLNEVRK